MKNHWFLVCFRPQDPPPRGGSDTGSTRDRHGLFFGAWGGQGRGDHVFAIFSRSTRDRHGIDTGSTRDRHGLIFFRWIF